MTPSDLELLQIEIETLWSRDERDRLVREQKPDGQAAPHLVLGVSSDGWTLALGSEVPDTLAADLQANAHADPPTSDPAAQPTAIARCEELLTAAVGPTELSSGPCFVIPAGTAFESSADTVRSTEEHVALIEGQDIEKWEADEWGDLLAGNLGPWAMALLGGKVVAICHSARLTDQGAEAGVWTDPDFRGQGHAAAVTAAWAAVLEGSGRVLFYSTAADNRSSQRVAARLGLRPIGWMWRIGAAP